MEPEPIMTKEEDKWFQWESYGGVPVPKVAVNKNAGERVLVSLMIARQIQRCKSRRLLKVLFDSDGNGSMIHSRALPHNASPVVNNESSRILTIADKFESKQMGRPQPKF
eukprot:9998738-Ditylum_brightwellii.AAC.1